MFLVNYQRGRSDAVGGESGGGARGRVGHNESKIRAAALLKSRFGSAITETTREGGISSFGDFGCRLQSI
jgi:hypothetical protein